MESQRKWRLRDSRRKENEKAKREKTFNSHGSVTGVSRRAYVVKFYVEASALSHFHPLVSTMRSIEPRKKAKHKLEYTIAVT